MKKSEINILVVDDDLAIRGMLSTALKRAGYNVFTEAHPEEALNRVKLQSINLAIVDCMLPAISGIDLVPKLRATTFADGPVILISGIFKDTAFIKETKEKIEIVDFIVKPFDVNSLIARVNTVLEPILDAPKIALHSLISSSNNSERKRRKAIDLIEEIVGYDLSLITCILLSSKSCGYLNIVSSSGDLIGITFYNGKILKIDSPHTNETIRLLLTQYGLLYNSELNDFESTLSSTEDILNSLRDTGLMSPHMVPVIRLQQILTELKNIIVNETFQFNFVKDESIKDTCEVNIDINVITSVIHEAIYRQTDSNWLVKFYNEWLEHPIKKGKEFQENHNLFTLPVVQKISKLKEYVSQELTLNDILEKNEYPISDLFSAIHLLTIRQIIEFSEVKKVDNVAQLETRILKIYNDVIDLDMDEIFIYFGCSKSLHSLEVARIYKEFTMNYHPDKLSSIKISDKTRDKNSKMFSKVTVAYTVLSNSESRQSFFEGQKESVLNQEIQLDEMYNDLLKMVEQKKEDIFQLGLKQLKAFNLIETKYHVAGLVLFRHLKGSGTYLTDEEFSEQSSTFLQITDQLTKNEYYYLILGLVYKEKGDFSKSEDFFNKSISISPSFLSSKRELSLLNHKKNSILSFKELLTGDMGSVFKKMFKK